MIDFWILGCQTIPQRAAVSFLNVWSCIMQHILKMYVQLFLFTDKKGSKSWREKTKGAKKIRYLFLLWNHIYLYNARKAATSPFFEGSLCCQGGGDKDCHNGTESKAELLHKPDENAEASFEIWKQVALFLLERKLIFPDLLIEAWPNMFLVSHWLIWKPSCCVRPGRRFHKRNKHRTYSQVRNISYVPNCWNFVLKTPKWRCI